MRADVGKPRVSGRRWSIGLAGLLTACLMPAASLAADGEGDTADLPNIMVSGERTLDAEEVRDAIRDVAMGGRAHFRPLERYQSPFCPAVLGLPERMQTYVTERLRSNASEAGLELGGEDCQVNAVMLVTDDQEKLIKNLRKNNQRLFTAGINREIGAALKRGDAAIVWSRFLFQGPRGRDGGTSGTNSSNALDGAFAVAGGAPRQNQQITASSFLVNYSIEKAITMMVIDVDRLNGVHLDQLSDFATLRILTEPQPDVEIAQEGARTILNLFDGAPNEAPMRMSALDRAYLKGLYAMRPNDPSTRLEYFVNLAYKDANDTAGKQAER